MTDPLSVTFHPQGPLRAGAVGTCQVTFLEPYEGESAELIVDAHEGTPSDQLGATRWWAEPSRAFRGTVDLAGIRIPPAWRQVTLRAALYREGERVTPLAGWRGATEPLALGAPPASSSPSRRAHVGRVDDRVTSFFDVLAARERGSATCGSVEEVVSYVVEGLRADLGALIDRVYRTYPDEIGEDGEPLTELMPWQKWAIRYCTGLYYSQNYYAVRSMERGLGYPIGVACTPNTDLYAWARGLSYGDQSTIPDGRNETWQNGACEAVLGANGGTDAGGFFHLVDHEDGHELSALRPGSILTYRGHVHTVFRVRRSPTRYQLFDTGGTAVGRRHRIPVALNGIWSGAMKEEPWRTGWPAYSRDHFVRGHLWVPSPPGERPQRELPRTLFCVPGGPSSEEISAASRKSPLARLCVVERPGQVRFVSSPLPLTAPITQLLFSVSNLPSSDRFEARWLVDGGLYNNHQSPGSGRLLLEIYNGGERRPSDRRSGDVEIVGKPRLWRAAYLKRRSGWPHPDIPSKRAEYLRDHGGDSERALTFVFDPSALQGEMDRKLFDALAEYPLDAPR